MYFLKDHNIYNICLLLYYLERYFVWHTSFPYNHLYILTIYLNVAFCCINTDIWNINGNRIHQSFILLRGIKMLIYIVELFLLILFFKSTKPLDR